jgi:pimeloyl-ACP methyl ester carboxylesterase
MITDPPTHLDLLWTDSSYVDLLLGFANGRRVIAFDRRGVGLSDSFDGAPTLEAQALDLEAVLDAAGAERPALFGYSGSGAIAAYFAATRPQRVDRLILLAPWDRDWSSDGSGWSDAERDAAVTKLDDALEHWGEGLMLRLLAPALDSPRNRRFFAMLERASVGRRLVRSTLKAAVETDISTVLPSAGASPQPS